MSLDATENAGLFDLTEELTALAADIHQALNALVLPTTANVRKVRREFSIRTRQLSPEELITLALKVMHADADMPRFFVYELVRYHKGAFQSLDPRTLQLLGEGIDSWGAVDTFASYLSGPAWRNHQIPDALIRKWARSKDRWWRRAAVVSTVPLNNRARGGKGDAERTLEICSLVLGDRDDMVVKALSWALRELAKSDPEAAEVFVIKHRDVLAPRVLREVENKLRTGLKNPRTKKQASKK